MIYAYVRVSREHQSGSSQEYEIRNWLKNKNMNADVWVSEQVSGTVDASKRKLGRAIGRMRKGDTLVCTEISRLGRNMLMIMSILNDCSRKDIRIRTIKDNFDLCNSINSKIIAFAFALAAEIERNLISQRTREALADRRAAGVVLGRPVGSSACRELIIREKGNILLQLRNGSSISSLSRKYGMSRNTFKKHLYGTGDPREGEVFKKS